MKVLKPGSISKIEKPFTKDAHMANINSFLSAAKSFGLTDDQLFKPEDLWEGTNIPKVVLCLLSIGKRVSYRDKKQLRSNINLNSISAF